MVGRSPVAFKFIFPDYNKLIFELHATTWPRGLPTLEDGSCSEQIAGAVEHCRGDLVKAAKDKEGGALRRLRQGRLHRR